MTAGVIELAAKPKRNDSVVIPEKVRIELCFLLPSLYHRVITLHNYALFPHLAALSPPWDVETSVGVSQDGKSGQRIIHPTVGPIANCVDDLNLAMTALCSPVMWDGDASLPRLPWDGKIVEDGPGRRLKVTD